MPFYAVSDLHLHDDEQPFLFTDEKEKTFVTVVDHILNEGGTLVLAGDTFDLTGMNPPQGGLTEFFADVLPTSSLDRAEIQDALLRRSLPELLTALLARFPRFFASLKALATLQRLIIVPGNHDCQLGTLLGQQEFARALGVSETAIQWMSKFESDGFLLSVHGHEFDQANRTERGCINPGAVMTSVLYRAVMPALRELGVPSQSVSAIPAVRPEEETVRGIELVLGEAQTRHFLLAFVRLLLKNGYFTGTKKWFLQRLLYGMPALARRYVTPKRVRAALPDDTHLKLTARQGARKIRGSHRVVFMGHTHELDLQPDYVNLGTWIDHMTGMTPEKIAQAEQTLPLLCVQENHTAILWDVRNFKESKVLSDCPVLWTYPEKSR